MQGRKYKGEQRSTALTADLPAASQNGLLLCFNLKLKPEVKFPPGNSLKALPINLVIHTF